ncbi:MAG: hypothetical protein ABIE14_04510 [Patescibacteria group bacterium]
MKHYEINELDFGSYRPEKLEVVGGSRPRLTLLKKGISSQKHFLKSYAHNPREIFAEFLASKLGKLAGLEIQTVNIKTFPKPLEEVFRKEFSMAKKKGGEPLLPKDWEPIGALVKNIFPGGFEIRYGSQIVGSNDKRLRLEEIGAEIRKRYYDAEDLLQSLADMIIFDAWIGNMDRHHENWGIVEHFDIRNGQEVIDPIVLKNKRYFTPLYDHGSSLLFELGNTEVEKYLNDKNLFQESYVFGKSYTFILDDKGKKKNIFDLIDCYIKKNKAWKKRLVKSIEKFEKIDNLDVAKIILQMPSNPRIDYSAKRRKLLFLSLSDRLKRLISLL